MDLDANRATVVDTMLFYGAIDECTSHADGAPWASLVPQSGNSAFLIVRESNKRFLISHLAQSLRAPAASYADCGEWCGPHLCRTCLPAGVAAQL